MTARLRTDRHLWAVAALTLLALAIRWACIHQGLFGDELFLWNIVHNHPLNNVLSVVRETEKTPPLGFVLSWATAHGPDAAALVRLPSVLASAATVPLVFALGANTVGARAGLVAAAWFALSPFEIFYGTESRSYALTTAFVVLSTLALLLALGDRRSRGWALYVLAASAAVYSHYTAVLVLLPQAGWALWTQRDRWREQLVANGLVVLAFAPWLPSFFVQLRHSGDEARRIAEAMPLSVANVLDTAGEPLIGHPYAPFAKVPGTVPLLLVGLVLAALLLSRLAARRRHAAGARNRGGPVEAASRRGLLLLLAAAPLAVVLAYSAQPHRSFLLSRNVAVAVPFAVLLFGALLAQPRTRIALVASFAVLAAVAVGAVQMLRPEFRRPDTRSAARFVDTHAPENSVVVDGLISTNLRPYLQVPHPLYSGTPFGPDQQAAAVRARSAIVVVFTRVPFYERVYAGRLPFAPHYRLLTRRAWSGAPAGIDARVYAPE